MKTFIYFLCLLMAKMIFAISCDQEAMNLAADKTGSVFERYLATGSPSSREGQPVFLRNSSTENKPFFTEITFLDVDLPSTMQINEIVERILYADVDVVHFNHVSTEKAKHLYEMLDHTYANFIHIPNNEKGLFIASKYPLSPVEMSQMEQQEDISQEGLEFAIHGANTYYAQINSNDSSVQIVNLEDHDTTTIPILLMDLPGVLRMIRQEYSPFRPLGKANLLTEDTFQIVPVKHQKKSSDDQAGYGVKVKVDYSWGGKEGGCWEGGAIIEGHDSRGNYVEAEVKQNSKGEGSMSARAGHEEK